jgi:hypothetical protein
MTWRKWFVRCLVFTVTGGLGAVGWLYQQWTNPASVRQQVIDQLKVYFVGANVSLDSAQMKLFGNISLRELRLSQRDESYKPDVLLVPEAIIHPDKEQVAQGKFAVRKIELHRAQMRIRRGPDGRWNFAGLLAPPNLAEPIPTIEFRQGTILIEDEYACAHLPVVEINDVNLTLVNDPLPTLRVQGQGSSRLARFLEVNGSIQRATQDATFRIKSTGIDVGPALNQRLSCYASELAENAQELTGVAEFEAQLTYHAGSDRPWSHHARWRLEQGNLRHARIPVPLEDIVADVRSVDGHLNIEKFAARSGTATIGLVASMKALREDADLNGKLTVEHLPVNSEIFTQLPPNLQKINHEFSPVGPVTIRLDFTRVAGAWVKRCTVQPEDLTARFHKFPYPLDHITGTLVQVTDEANKKDELLVDLVGLAGESRVHIKGEVHGLAPNQSVDFTVWGEDIVLTQKLLDALPSRHRKVAEQFHAVGRADFKARIRRDAGHDDWVNRFLITFHHAAVKYDLFPYPLEDVSGVLDIQSGRWDARDFRGTHKGGTFFASADMHSTAEGEKLTLNAWGENLTLDDDLRNALTAPELKQAWKTVRPGGRVAFNAQLTRLADQPPDIQVAVTATGSTMRPEFFDCPLHDVTGTLKYAKRWVQIENLTARHGRSVLHLKEGRIFLNPEGGIWADIASLRGEPLVLEGEMLDALPPVLRRACESVRLRDPLQLSTRLVIATTKDNHANPDIWWEGKLAVRDAQLQFGVPLQHVTGEIACTGRYKGQRLDGIVGNIALNNATLFDQPFRAIQGPIEVHRDTPDILVIKDLHALLHGGEVYGPIRVEFGSRVRYELDMTASRISLEQFGQHNLGKDAKLSGLATARLHLEGKGPDLHELKGIGSIDVPNGRLGPPLPLLLELLKFLSIRLPDGTAFEEAHASFTINGPRVRVERVDLFGNSISLRGKGEMNYDGTGLDMDFYAVWARVTQLLPPIIKDLPHDVSKHLLKIHATGRLGDVHFTKEPVPSLVEPLKGLLERMAGRMRGT